MALHAEYEQSAIHNNVHCGLAAPSSDDTYMIGGEYKYYHYAIDGLDDKGWGCGYRTLQTLCSWVNMSTEIGRTSARLVPSLVEIQEILVNVGDQEPNFLGSKSWIGSFEVMLVIERLYNVQSKIVHLRPGCLCTKEIEFLKDHFDQFKSPVMMGGDVDGASKCILGITYHKNLNPSNIYLLILDPHFVKKGNTTLKLLQDEGWISWKRLCDFDQNSFYNFCLPQILVD